MSRCKGVLLAALLVFFAVTSGFTAEDSSWWLISPKLLEHAKLKIRWQNKLPLKKSEHLARLVILGEHLYAFSSRNYMVSLNPENGDMMFGRSVAPAGFAIVGLQRYENELISIIGNRLVELDAKSGKELRCKHPGFGLVCPAVRNNSFFYLAGTDRRLHALQADDMVKVYEAAAQNDSMITSILAEDNLVVFATDAGNVIGVRPDRAVQLWQFDAAGGIVGPIVKEESSLFFASKDTNVYRVEMAGPGSVRLIWKCQTDAVLDKAPRLTAKVVYQQVGVKGLVAIDKKSGRILWQLAEGVDLLAEAQDKAYVITKLKTLAVMDNIHAKMLYSVNFAPVSRYAANTRDARIYIASRDGRVACLISAEE